MEGYQLSAVFAEKQLELLERKYGGTSKAGEAALTIQRAFRRYSMGKKFADLTAQIKTEKRISRRLEYPRASGSGRSPARGNGEHYPQCPANRGSFKERKASGSLVQETYGQHKHPPPLQSQPSESALINFNSYPASGETEANNSCPDIQSFPLDENSVYSHSPYGGSRTNSGAADRERNVIRVAVRSSSLHREDGKSNQSSSTRSSDSKPVRKSNSSTSTSHSTPSPPQAVDKSAPHVPVRTVSRLTSMESRGSEASNEPASLSSRSPHPSGAVGLDAVDVAFSTRAPTAHFRRPHHHHHHHHVHPAPQTVISVNPSLYRSPTSSSASTTATTDCYTVNEVLRKRHYRTGLNIYNKKPEKGITYLIRRGFLENSPQAVARFLVTRKGLSKQMIGEYLGNINHTFNMAVLNHFASEMDFSNMQIDTALRKFQTYFRMPGEAQKIERLMEVFSNPYCQCNPELMSKFQSTDSVFILSFAIILLNTDLHTPSLKPEKRMKLADFVRNLRGIDNGQDVDQGMLIGIYERIRNQEFRPGSDHVTQVLKVQQTIVAKCPNLAVPHRRLVCYCRLYEIHDAYKKERPGIHQREVFLFNDILVITKIHSRKKNSVTYAFRQSYILAGMVITIFETQFYPYGIQIAQKWDGKTILMLNARNEHDRSKFVEDLKESVAEMDEMESIRLESELEKQRLSMTNENRDSGITDSPSEAVVTSLGVESQASSSHHHAHGKSQGASHGHYRRVSSGTSMSHGGHNNNASGGVSNGGVVLRRSAINNSLLDLSDATAEKINRRGSVGSLDSGMSVSFQSTSVGSYGMANASNGSPATSSGGNAGNGVAGRGHPYQNPHHNHHRSQERRHFQQRNNNYESKLPP